MGETAEANRYSGSHQDFVSVIIPVFNDPVRLALCLQALENQSYSKSLYEVIVVDNGSDEPVAPVVAGFSQAKATYEKKSSSYAARNKGLQLARGDIFAFTDSDCIPAPDWIANGVAKLNQIPGCGLVAGRIEVFFNNPKRPTAVELYQSITAFQQQINVEKSRFGVTANLFTRRNVVEHVGLFDASLTSGGDYEWGQRVFAAGYPMVYAEDACVAHPARSSLAQLCKRVVRVTGGTEDVLRMQSTPKTVRFSIVAAGTEFIKSLLPNLRKAVRIYSDPRLRNTGQRTKVALTALFVAYLRMWEKWRIRLHG